ncbi:respiratory nitrate reductase subunit gamma [Actinomadura fibrosa]|uniref:Respiratory nitrate reductase subunit gamma n=1 Tax=Actinomadura fibrosa TaxID=111802 RepID=A0ABW2XR37_9ACTN
MTGTPFIFQVHTLLGVALFALWPFQPPRPRVRRAARLSRRPYVVYRSRGGAR